MDREIKFRAWLENVPEKWLDGPMDGVMYYSVDEENVYGDAIEDFFSCIKFENSPGFKYTLMQYTGLKDKNGKEIFEGDIVDSSEIICPCKVFCRFGCWYVEGHQELGYCGDIEVIGNIYEHADLLEN